MFEKLFKLKEKGTTIKTEVIAGVTTFLAMAYILAVNPTMLKEAGLSYDSVFLATALSAGIATLIMGLLANYPVALAPGMGVNALFTYTIVLTMGYSPEAALAAVVVSGLIFLIISVTGIRKAIINAIPHQLKLSIGAGIGFFIAFIGFKNAGIIVGSDSTFVALGDLTNPVVLLALFGILITIILMAKKVFLYFCASGTETNIKLYTLWLIFLHALKKMQADLSVSTCRTPTDISRSPNWRARSVPTWFSGAKRCSTGV